MEFVFAGGQGAAALAEHDVGRGARSRGQVARGEGQGDGARCLDAIDGCIDNVLTCPPGAGFVELDRESIEAADLGAGLRRQRGAGAQSEKKAGANEERASHGFYLVVPER